DAAAEQQSPRGSEPESPLKEASVGDREQFPEVLSEELRLTINNAVGNGADRISEQDAYDLNPIADDLVRTTVDNGRIRPSHVQRLREIVRNCIAYRSKARKGGPGGPSGATEPGAGGGSSGPTAPSRGGSSSGGPPSSGGSPSGGPPSVGGGP